MVICPRCGHTWEPRTGSARLHCSNCSASFARPAPKIEIVGKCTEPTTCDFCGGGAFWINVCRVDGEAALICDACLKQK